MCVMNMCKCSHVILAIYKGLNMKNMTALTSSLSLSLFETESWLRVINNGLYQGWNGCCYSNFQFIWMINCLNIIASHIAYLYIFVWPKLLQGYVASFTKKIDIKENVYAFNFPHLWSDNIHECLKKKTPDAIFWLGWFSLKFNASQKYLASSHLLPSHMKILVRFSTISKAYIFLANFFLWRK